MKNSIENKENKFYSKFCTFIDYSKQVQRKNSIISLAKVLKESSIDGIEIKDYSHKSSKGSAKDASKKK